MKSHGMCVENVRARIQKIKLRDIFFSFLCQKQVNFVAKLYFCCIVYLFEGSCSLMIYEKIETFICQLQKQSLAFQIDNFWLSKFLRLNEEK